MKSSEDTFTQPSDLLGHPRGLTTLFFTEMWERFSFYGMRAILLYYMTFPVTQGGLGLGVPRAAGIYGLYTAAVYLLALPGGLLADRLLGTQRAVVVGGGIIAIGHFCMAFGPLPFFYVGLVLIAVGTGLLKPNISALVGTLYAPTDPRRDGGFILFFVGINLGATLAPLVCGYLAQAPGFRAWLVAGGLDPNRSWHWGFGVAGVGMLIGLAQFLFNPLPASPAAASRPVSAGNPLDFPAVSMQLALTSVEGRRVAAIFILVLFTIVFGLASEQAGSSLNLFAHHLTRNQVLGYTFPSSWFQAAVPVYVLLLSPVFAWLWGWLGTRQPSSPAKFSLSLLFAGLAFLLMVPACLAAQSGAVSPLWLLGVFFLQEVGAVMLNTAGLSTISKLAPARLGGALMGVWFLASAAASFLAGQFARRFDAAQPLQLAYTFGAVAALVLVAAGLLALLTPWVRRLMGGVR